MATYYIVEHDKDPLGEDEVHAGDTIDVSEGDVFVIGPEADDDIKFSADGNSPTSFEIKVVSGHHDKFEIEIDHDLEATIDIADNTDLSEVEIKAEDADSVILTAGDNVSLKKFYGSKDGADDLVLGDNFVAEKIDTKGGDDTLFVGENARIKEIKTSKGDDIVALGDGFSGDKVITGSDDDQVTIGHDATVKEIKTEKGDDEVVISSGFSGEKVDTKEGDDSVVLGNDVSINKLDGGSGNDALLTGTVMPKAEEFETSAVCFVRGSLIRTPHGEVPIEQLKPGDKVETLDRGPRDIRWIGSSIVEGFGALAPVCIAAGAMGNTRDLWLSQQHRVLHGSWRTELHFGCAQVLVAAKHLVNGRDIRIVERSSVVYFHMLFDRHEVVFAEGLASESFHPGDVGMTALCNAAQEEIHSIFPEMAGHWHRFGPSARYSLKGYESALIGLDQPFSAIETQNADPMQRSAFQNSGG